MPIPSNPKLVVSGAAGQLGRKTVEFLLEKVPASSIRALSRDPAKIAGFSAQGIETRAADFNAPEALPAAFEGGDVLLLISTNDLGNRLRQHKAAVDAAKVAGIQHIIYTSVTDPRPENPLILAVDHRTTERFLVESGLAWTALRNSLYANNFFFPGGLAHGVPTSNVGTGPVGYVTRDDCAAVAAGVLADAARYAGKALDVTGPEAIDGEGLASLISEVIGRPFEIKKLSDDAYTAALISAGLPPDVAAIYASFGTAAREGWFNHVSDTVAKVTGRPATTLKAFFEANRDILLAATA